MAIGCNFPVPCYRLDGTHAYRPCGSCTGCRLEQSRQWAVRCFHESQLHKDNSFITLTYNPENLPADNSISKDELQRFFKRLRRKIEPKKVRYFACGEYGDKTERPHYHAIVFNLPKPFDKYIRKAWKLGHIHIGTVTEASIFYTTKYA